jgi:hypothetical protein
MNAVILLARNGYEIDIFTTSDLHHTIPKFDDERIHLIFRRSDVRCSNLPIISNLACYFSDKRKKTSISIFVKILHLINYWYFSLKNKFLPFIIFFSHYRKPYTGFIFVDPWGLIEAEHLLKFAHIPMIYYSLELIFSDEINDQHYKIIKNKERELCKKIIFAIIQDHERASLLSNENNIPPEKIVLVPNAPLGPSRKIANRYWHQRFNLSPETKIVLHTGSLGEWTGLDMIIDSVKYWPENWVFIIHTRYTVKNFPTDDSNKYFLKIIQENPLLKGRVFISQNPVHSDEYDQLIDGADIGIALYFFDRRYELTGKNLETVGLSSGKIAYYLKAGLPVITNLQSGIGTLLFENKCGIIINSSQDIGQAIMDISNQYMEYSNNAQILFDSRLNVEHAFHQVLVRLDAINR